MEGLTNNQKPETNDQIFHDAAPERHIAALVLTVSPI